MAANSERGPSQPTNQTEYRVVVAAPDQPSTFAVVAALDAREDIVVVEEACSLEEFLASVDALRDGGAALDPFTARIAVAAVRRDTQLDRHARPRLTERESEVLQLRARGLRVGELARQLAVSANTVKHHLLRIREKLLGMAAG